MATATRYRHTNRNDVVMISSIIPTGLLAYDYGGSIRLDSHYS